MKQKAYADSALGLSNEAWVTVNPHVLLFVFLPVLIFESAINCEWHIFKRQVDLRFESSHFTHAHLYCPS